MTSPISLLSFLPVLSALLTALGIWFAVRSPERQRAKQRVEVAQAAIRIAADAMDLVADRLAIRFDPARLQDETTSMRQLRTSACLETLREFRVADLPPTLIEHFSAVRGGLAALNESMSAEANGTWPPDRKRLRHYEKVWTSTAERFESLRETARNLRLTPPEGPKWVPDLPAEMP